MIFRIIPHKLHISEINIALFFAEVNNVYKFHKYNKTDRKANTLIEPTFMISLSTFFVSVIELKIELASRKQSNTKQPQKWKKSLHIERKPLPQKPCTTINKVC